jgi:hypothetical protein
MNEEFVMHILVGSGFVLASLGLSLTVYSITLELFGSTYVGLEFLCSVTLSVLLVMLSILGGIIVKLLFDLRRM